MRFKDIKRVTSWGNYQVNMGWDYIKEHWLERWAEPRDGMAALDLDPDFQRGHVWTEAQQIAYVEYKLKGGQGSDVILFNCVGWMGSYKGPFVLVDGKQRLTAVLAFLDNKIPAFGHYYSEYEDRLPSHAEFIFHVNDLKTRAEVLQWYLEINSGGTPHTEEEIQKVRDLLTKE